MLCWMGGWGDARCSFFAFERHNWTSALRGSWSPQLTRGELDWEDGQSMPIAVEPCWSGKDSCQ